MQIIGLKLLKTWEYVWAIATIIFSYTDPPVVVVIVVVVVVVYLHDNKQISYRYEYNPKLTPCKQGPHRSSQLII